MSSGVSVKLTSLILFKQYNKHQKGGIKRMLEEYPDVMTTKEVMEVLAISKELLYELVRLKQLPAYRLGKKSWRFNKSSLINHLINLEK